MLPDPAVAAERQAAEDHYGNGATAAYPFTQYKNYAVGLKLHTLFYGKCAYCQSEVGAPNDEEIEHYRPKGSVRGTDHSGYWWLASQWTNLLLSCTGCNQGRKQHLVTPQMTEAEYLALIAAPPRQTVGKHEQFPIAGQRSLCETDDHDLEDALLIEPTVRDPAEHLSWSIKYHYSVVLPAHGVNGESLYGATTIEVCALNRSKLVEARTGLLQQLRMLRTQILERLQADDSPEAVRYARDRVEVMRTFTLPDRPYSAMALAFVADVAAEIGTLREP